MPPASVPGPQASARRVVAHAAPEPDPSLVVLELPQVTIFPGSVAETYLTFESNFHARFLLEALVVRPTHSAASLREFVSRASLDDVELPLERVRFEPVGAVFDLKEATSIAPGQKLVVRIANQGMTSVTVEPVARGRAAS